jgi:hypothetical protein
MQKEPELEKLKRAGIGEDIVEDAEFATKAKNIDHKEHLAHLLKIGWSKESKLIKDFATKHKISLT